jgi:hypothetical protein
LYQDTLADFNCTGRGHCPGGPVRADVDVGFIEFRTLGYAAPLNNPDFKISASVQKFASSHTGKA